MRRRRRRSCQHRSMRLPSQWEEEGWMGLAGSGAGGGCPSNSTERLCPLPARHQAGKFPMMALNVFVSLMPSPYVIWVTLLLRPFSLRPSGKAGRESFLPLSC